ncbi:MAG TPA: MFS transporter [Candidatus Dojkabacteria bacterium]
MKRIFYSLLANTVFSTITNMTVWFALTFFVYLQTEKVLATAIISGIYLVAVALSGFWFGSLVDHYKKKTMMLFSSIFSLAIYLVGFAIYLLVAKETFTDISSPILWVFVALLMIGVVIGNIRTIALPPLVTVLIPEKTRDKANGLVGSATGVAFLVTSVISGLLVGISGMFLVLLLAIIVTVLSIVHLLTIDVPENKVIHIDTPESPTKMDIKGTIKIVKAVPGLLALILFSTFNNFLGGVFMALMDAYGLSLVSVEIWGLLWGVLSTAFIIGGLIIAKVGLGKKPLRALFVANIVIWTISSVFTIQSSVILLVIGMFIYLAVVPFIEAAEHTIIQKAVPVDRQGRVFGFAQSIEQAASPLTAFLIGPIAQFIFIPFMTTGRGAELIGSWYGTGDARGIALVFTITGIIGLLATIAAMNSPFYKRLSKEYAKK